MENRKRSNAAGFTLVELLVVITIIGILTALVSVAAVGALDQAKQTAIKSELDQLDMAMKDFKNKYGAYPPCNLSNPSTNTTLQSFVIQAFPRYPITQLVSDWTTLNIDQVNSHPDRALVFWLSGFSPDVTNPFTGAGQRTPFFTFDQTRLTYMSTSSDGKAVAGSTAMPALSNVANNYLGLIAYMPQRGNGAPYAYIDANSYGALAATPVISSFSMANATGVSIGTVTPYVQDLQNTGSFITSNLTAYQFCNPQTFQIISAGQDGYFGFLNAATQSAAPNVRLFPTGYGWDATGAEMDNISNFSGSARLGDTLP